MMHRPIALLNKKLLLRRPSHVAEALTLAKGPAAVKPRAALAAGGPPSRGRGSAARFSARCVCKASVTCPDLACGEHVAGYNLLREAGMAEGRVRVRVRGRRQGGEARGTRPVEHCDGWWAGGSAKRGKLDLRMSAEVV